MTAEIPVVGLGRVLEHRLGSEAVDRLEAFVALAQKDPSSAALLIGRTGVVRDVFSADSGD